jgi:hypothetical protein
MTEPMHDPDDDFEPLPFEDGHEDDTEESPAEDDTEESPA